MQTTYFDTSDFSLAEQGVSLRIRKQGRRLTQTVKSLNGKTAPRWDRAEQDAAVSAVAPEPALIEDGYIRKKLTHWTEAGELKPVFETDVRRTAIPLMSEEGLKVEAAFDYGSIRALGAKEGVSQPVAELELELKEGDSAALFALARLVARETPLRFSLESKADRGYALAQGATDKPVRAKPLTLNGDMRTSDAFALIMHEGLKQMIANENAILRGRDVEGIHQMRVAIRRLRSAIAAFGNAYDHSEIARLKGEMKWIASVLGCARDWDVFQNRTFAPVFAAFPKDSGLFAMAAAIRRVRRDAWAQAVAQLESERYRLFVIDIAAAISGHVWVDQTQSQTALAEDKTCPYERPLSKTAQKCLDKRLAKVEELGLRMADLAIEERHELRIRLKRLRYSADFLASCYARKSTKRYLASLSDLQDVFGELNDDAVAVQLVGKLLQTTEDTNDEPPEADLQRAGGLVIGWHMASGERLWEQAQRRWRRFADAEPFWR